MRCVYCWRYFSDERIEKHQAITAGPATVARCPKNGSQNGLADDSNDFPSIRARVSTCVSMFLFFGEPVHGRIRTKKHEVFWDAWGGMGWVLPRCWLQSPTMLDEPFFLPVVVVTP